MSSTDFSKMVPGFDFLQNLMKGASSSMPNVGQWVAPTLDPAELDKRIDELRTVQFWLEQNAKLLGGTIQALEVQRMTLSTLKSMNLPVADFSEAFKLKVPTASASAPAADESPAPSSAGRRRKAPQAQAPAAAGLVDPMQWWGALTQQFTEIAAKAVKDSSAQAAQQAATSMGRQAAEAAQEAFKAAAAMPAQAAKQAVKMAKTASGGTRGKLANPRKR